MRIITVTDQPSNINRVFTDEIVYSANNVYVRYAHTSYKHDDITNAPDMYTRRKYERRRAPLDAFPLGRDLTPPTPTPCAHNKWPRTIECKRFARRFSFVTIGFAATLTDGRYEWENSHNIVFFVRPIVSAQTSTNSENTLGFHDF